MIFRGVDCRFEKLIYLDLVYSHKCKWLCDWCRALKVVYR